jgi:hypothetical protein
MALLFLDQAQIHKHKITAADVKGCDYDTVRAGYWIKSDSPEAVWLTLKGLTLRRLHYNPENPGPKIPKTEIKCCKKTT